MIPLPLQRLIRVRPPAPQVLTHLERVGDTLRVRGCDQPVDLVYLRSTDFRLATETHATLRAAHVDDVVVVTPPPRAHALYADKANLALLSDAAVLRELGASEADVQTLVTHIPVTKRVADLPADTLCSGSTSASPT